SVSPLDWGSAGFLPVSLVRSGSFATTFVPSLPSCGGCEVPLSACEGSPAGCFEELFDESVFGALPSSCSGVLSPLKTYQPSRPAIATTATPIQVNLRDNSRCEPLS